MIEEGLYKYSFENQSKEKLYEADITMGLCQVSMDDKYIYLNNERWSAFMRAPEIEPQLVVLNHAGEQINVIPTGTYITFFGDKDNLLFNIKKSKDNTIPGYKSIGLINKNDIETAETWEEIK